MSRTFIGNAHVVRAQTVRRIASAIAQKCTLSETSGAGVDGFAA